MSVGTEPSRPASEHSSPIEQAMETGQEARSKAGGRIARELDERTSEAGGQVSSLSQALRRTSEQLRSEGRSDVARILDMASEKGERLGGYLERADGRQLLNEAEDFARRRPWLVAGGSFVGGLALSRMLKASSSGRYESRFGDRARSSAPTGQAGNVHETPWSPAQAGTTPSPEESQFTPGYTTTGTTG